MLRTLTTPFFIACLFGAFVCQPLRAELQTTLSVTAPDLGPGESNSFSATTVNGPAGSTTSTLINPYAGILQYVLSPGTGRFSSLSGTRYGVQFDSFQLFQSFLSTNFFTMVSSSTNCPASGNYTWLNIRWRSPDSPLNPTNATTVGRGAGGALSYASDTFSSTSYFDIAGPTNYNSAYGYDSSPYGACSSGVLKTNLTGANVGDGRVRFFFGSNFGFSVAAGGNPLMTLLVPAQTLTVGIMSNLAKHVYSGIFTTFDSNSSQTQANIYAYPDAAGTTYTLRSVSNFSDPTSFATYGSLVCTTLNSPSNGFCRGTLTMQGVSGSGNAVCQIGSTAAQDVISCTFQRPNDNRIGGSLIVTRNKISLLQVSAGTPPNIAPGNSGNVSVTLRNMTGSQITGLSVPANPAEQLVSPMTNPTFPGGGSCGTTLDGYATCTISVPYNPSSPGTELQTLRVAYHNQASTLNGTGPLVAASGLSSIAISPNSSYFANATSQQFTATATFSNGATQNVTSLSTWGSTQTGVATISSTGLANFVGVGATTISADFAGVTGNFSTNSYTVPPNPSGLNAVANGYTQVDLNWTSGGGATASFQIAYQTGSTAPANCESGTIISSGIVGSATNYSVTSLTPGTQYAFRVCASGAAAGSLSSGITGTATTGIPHSIFSTSATYRGNMGGLYMADFICQSEAEAAGHTGIWKAVLSDETTAASSRISLSQSIYNLRPSGSGGIQLISTAGAFWGAHSAVINYNASGNSPGSGNIWGGSTNAGGINTGLTCTSWTTSSSGVNGRYGLSTVSTTAWVNQASLNCASLNSLYCINLQSSSAAPPNPASFTAYTVGPTSLSFLFSSGGGTTAAYKIAYQTGGTAPANCSSGTVISASTIGLNPSVYNVTGLSSSTQYSFRLCAVNSDQSSASSGLTLTGTTSANGSSVTTDLSTRQVVFGTTGTYYGNFGSIYFGDYICQAEADSAGLTGVWKAILSDESVSATSRIAIPGKVYNFRPLASGGLQEIAANSAAFWASSAAYQAYYNAGGGNPGSTQSWTGSSAAGAINAGNTCTSWTTSSSGTNGTVGTSNTTGNIINAGNIACNNLRSLYCTNQQSASAAPPDPTGFATYTLGPTSISFIWASGGGTTAAYKLAYQTGGTAPASCSAGTVVSAQTIGLNATSYTVSGLSSSTQYSFRLCALNSNQSSSSSGTTVTASTLASGSSVIVDLSSRQVVFSTGSTTNGSFGGLYFADFMCQTEATNAGLTGGIWKAILSDESTSATSRIAMAGKVYNMRPLGSGGIQEIAPNSSAFWSSSNAYAVNYNAAGSSPGSANTWSGTTAAGAIQSGVTCSSWTTASSGTTGRQGTNTTVGNFVSTANAACNNLMSLYCTNQQTSSAAPPDPTGFATYTLGPTSLSFVWASGGGTTAAYKLAYQTGGTAPANCSSGTVISATTLGNNPTSYTVTSLSSSTQYSFRLCAVNSDQSSASSGVTVTTSTLSSGSSTQIDLSTRQVVFATTNLYNGAFGGLYYGDFICQTEADTAGITGVWKAILSDEATSASSRISIPGKVYNYRPLSSGGIQEIAADSSSFWGSSATYAVNYNATGTTPGSTITWTGSTAAGSINTGATCTSWTDSGSGVNGQYGTNTNTGNIINTNATACNTTRTLYCTNQQSSSAAPSDPADFATYTLSPSAISFIWTSGGGTTAAFKLAYQTGGTAPANCNSGTVVPATTLGVNPSSYTLNGLSSSTQYSFRLCAVNSDQSQASAGLTVTATTLDPGQPVTVDLSTRQVVFTTSATYRGIFGGLMFADFLCQNEAADSGLSGVWKAILSDDSTSALSRIAIPGKVYNMRPLASGGIQQIAPNSAGFWGSSASNNVYYNAGGTTPGAVNPWTGSTAAGAIQSSNTCSSWTTNNATPTGRLGTANITGNIISTANSNCNVVRSLYCTNQQTSPSAPADPTGFAVIATSPSAIGLKWASGGGTTAGYKIAYQTGGTAPANCASGTVIPATTIGLNPTTYSVIGLTANTQYSFRLCSVNSDQSSTSSGVTATTSTLASGSSPTYDYSATQVVFATTTRVSGNMGGLHYADWICYREASSSGLTGVWKAILSDESTSAASRLTVTGPVYNNRAASSGGIQRIATNSTAFWTAIYEYALAYTQDGVAPAVANTWTGSTAAGAINTGLTCTSWTSSAGGVNGRVGANTTVAGTGAINNGNSACNNTNHLYCINLQSAAAAPPNPGSFAVGSVGTTSIPLTWASGGGTTAAYKLAYQAGASAPADCNSGTTIPSATLGVNPTGYTVTGLSSGTQYSFRICALNSNESQMSSGSTVSGTTTSLTPPANQTLFATGTNYSALLGGLYFADYICQTEATSAGLAGIWKAVLSDESTSAASRIALSATIWNNRPAGSGGAQQITTSANFWSVAYTVAPNYNAAGGSPAGNPTWTGSTTAGGVNTGLTCSSWGSNAAGSNGRYGNNNQTAVANLYNTASTACSTSRALYCIDQQTSSAAPSDPTGFSSIFATTSTVGLVWSSGGGTTAAYQLAYQSGGTAPSDCTSGTVVSASTLGINPSSYTVTGLSSNTQYSFRLCAANSDVSSLSTGVTLSVTTQSSGTSFTPGSNQIIFATTNTYRGSFGGIYFGDYICQAEAETAGLPGIWKAVLSDTGTSAASRLTLSGEIHNLRDPLAGGSQRVINASNFWNHLHTNAINYTPTGGLATTGLAWTGTTTAGAADTQTCVDWTSQLAGNTGRYGTTTSATSPYSTGNRACNNLTNLYCINQQSSAATPNDPSSFGTYSTSATSVGFTWVSGGGTTAAYKLAYQTGGTAPANCSTGTIIEAGTLGVNPTTYTVTGLSPSTQYSFRLCAYNSDRTASSTGVTATATTPASGSTISLGSTQVVFGTERTYSGRIGGLYFADYACQMEAEEVGLGGVWKAVLSTSATNAATRISLSSLIYNTRSTNEGGIQQISDSTNFWAGPWSNVANYSVDGDPPGSTRGWTGSANTGIVDASNHCADWTSGTSTTNGRHGNFATATNPINANVAACSNLSSLYCINQQTAAAAPADPATFDAVATGSSYISFAWTSGGGTTAAYKMSYQTGGTAPASCSAGTVIAASTLGVNPKTYTLTGLSSNTQYSFRLCATNSDQSSVSSGITATVTTTSSGTTFSVGSSQFMFSTAATYTGNLGSMYMADFACQTEASAAGLSGVWKAALSDSSTNLASRIAVSGTIYNLRTGAAGGIQEVTDSSVFLLNSTLRNQANYSASGGTPGSTNVWTGSTTAGVAGVHCSDWTTAGASTSGATGTNNTANAYLFSTNNTCNNARSLLCLNQQSASAAPANPGSFTYTSVGSTTVTLNWASGGGTTAGYKIAYQTGGTAPADCTLGTVISATTLGVNPKAYTVSALSAATQYSFRICAVNSDQSSVSTGTTLSVTTTSGGTTFNPGSTNFIFSTANTYYGNFGGIYFGDYICQSEAEAAGLTGIWKAIISDESTAISSRVSLSGPVFNMRTAGAGGIQAVTTGADLFANSTVSALFNFTAAGASPGSNFGWTGSTVAGAVNTGLTCSSWTVGATTSNGGIGRNYLTTANVYSQNTNCGTARGLFCVNQQSSSAAPPDPASFATLATGSSFVTFAFSSGGGTTAAYKMSYQAGGTAPVDCDTGTVVTAATLGVNPTSYTVTSLSSSTQYSFRLCALNSDSSSASSGLTATVTTTSGATTYNIGSNQFIFPSASTYYGNFGGLITGDYICQNEAIAAGLSGVWKMVASDAATTASSRIALSGKMYNLRPGGSGGIQRVSDANSFFSLGTLQANFNYNASGTSPGTVNQWTGSTAAGIANGTNYCASWTSSTSSTNGTTGRSDLLTQPLISQNLACNTARSLVCINQQSAGATPPDPTDFYADFNGSTYVGLTWASGGGSTATYKIAYQTGGTAPADCNSGTTVSSSSLDLAATSYGISGLTPSTQYSFRICALNSDLSAMSAGTTLTVTTPASGLTFSPGTNQYMFTTSATYTGNIGGLNYADFICQNEATSAGLGGVWKAVLGDDTNGVASRLSFSSNIYNMRPASSGGSQRIASSAYILDGILNKVHNYTASGATASAIRTWTGSGAAGATITTQVCTNWTTTAGTGRYGTVNTQLNTWLNSGANANCTTAYALSCINQQTSPSAPPDPASFSTGTITTSSIQFTFSSGGGTTAGYRLAYQLGATPPTNCTTGTVVPSATLGVNPTSYTVTGLSSATQYSFRFCATNSDQSDDSTGLTQTVSTN